MLCLFTNDTEPSPDYSLTEQQLCHPVQSTDSLPALLQECCIATYGRPMPARLLSHLNINGITYSSSSFHLGNASILLKSPAPNRYLPARIDYIAQVLFDDTDDRHMITFIAARRYQAASIKNDPFRLFPFLQAQLWSNNLDPLELYPLNAIECHFAQTPILWEGSQMFVMSSLSRVCIYELWLAQLSYMLF